MPRGETEYYRGYQEAIEKGDFLYARALGSIFHKLVIERAPVLDEFELRGLEVVGQELIPDIESAKDDTSHFEPRIKRLGSLLIVRARVRDSWDDKGANIHLQKGTPLLNIHLAPLAPGEYLHDTIDNSLSLLADYVNNFPSLSDSIVTITTHSELNSIFELRGFATGDSLVPDLVQSSVRSSYESGIVGTAREIGEIRTSYMHSRQLVERFGRGLRRKSR